MATRTIVHQFDPAAPRIGGIDTCISDIIAYSPPDTRLAIVGATARPHAVLGKWEELQHRGRHLMFMPVTRLWRKVARPVPDSVRLALGLARWRKRIPEAPLQIHRIDVAAAMQALRTGTGPHIQFIHNPHALGAGVLGSGSDSFWRFAPRVYHALEKSVLRRAPTVAVFSRSEAERLQALGIPAQAWQTWFDPQVFFPADRAPPERLHVAWVGRFDHQKDPALAIETILGMAAEGADIHATFVGDGPLLNPIRARAAVQRHADVLSFTGSVGREQVAAALRSADVLLLTSHYEGSPRILIEALACGTPIAGTAASDPDGLVVGRVNGVVSAARTAKALSEAIEGAAACSSSACVASVRDLRADTAVPHLLTATAIPEL